MSDGNSIRRKLSWPKTLVKKWFNIKSKNDETLADDFSRGGVHHKKDFIKRSKREKMSKRSSERTGRCNIHHDQFTDFRHYRVFVSTWNVAGRSPPSHLNLESWLQTSPPADIYVLGFQEIVPLNAGNVLGTEDNGPARKWLSLIKQTLNNLHGAAYTCRSPSPIPDPIVESDADFEESTVHDASSSFFPRRSFHSRSLRMTSQPKLERRFSVCDHGNGDAYFNSESSGDENELRDSPYPLQCSGPPCGYSGLMEETCDLAGKSRYCLVASKQMVGIFLTIWVRSDLSHGVRNLKVSRVGRGLMGYLGNKGSISISMSLYQTSFCFVCSHLTSGQKEGDGLRRNSDVIEILRKTRFPQVHGLDDVNSPRTILEHDRVIWLGDLNYRISLSYRAAKALVEMRNWRALFENDQLGIERGQGRVFEGWSEGTIYFPPTYKYSNNSDRYAGDNRHIKEKRRTPAWCDRILWYGRGLSQLSYICGESRFSDHRPVCSTFLAEVEITTRGWNRKGIGSGTRVEVEELLPYFYGYRHAGFI